MNFGTAYHPLTDGQMKRVNHIIEDMIRMYVMNKPTKWEDYLHLTDFVYNNGYETSTNMSPFEVLYRWKCRTLVAWDNPMEQLMLGPDLLMDLEQLVTKVQVNLKESKTSQKFTQIKK